MRENPFEATPVDTTPADATPADSSMSASNVKVWIRHFPVLLLSPSRFVCYYVILTICAYLILCLCLASNRNESLTL